MVGPVGPVQDQVHDDKYQIVCEIAPHTSKSYRFLGVSWGHVVDGSEIQGAPHGMFKKPLVKKWLLGFVIRSTRSVEKTDKKHGKNSLPRPEFLDFVERF